MLHKIKRRRKRKYQINNIAKLIFSCSIFILMIWFFFHVGDKLIAKNNIIVSAGVMHDDKAYDKNNVSQIKQKETLQSYESSNNGQVKNLEGYNDDEIKFMRNQNKIYKPKPDEVKVSQDPNQKIVYLTFDDGPSTTVTPLILDTLKKYDIKATFFIIGSMAENNKDLVRRVVNEGHRIGNHTFSHKIDNFLYINTKNFMDDLIKGENVLKTIIPDYNEKLIRFPGGSFGQARASFRQAVSDAGYHYVDWNCINGDSEGQKVSVEKLIQKVKDTTHGNTITVLMHDTYGKETTATALPQIIEFFKSKGYSFQMLK